MNEKDFPADLREAVRFHGHFCPGLAIGYRAAKIGLEELGAQRAEDEELIAIVENDSCAVDAVQWLTGCTFGKGNFFFRDYGKQAFTFALRPSGRAVRVALKPREESHAHGAARSREAEADRVLSGPADALFKIEHLTVELPGAARIHDSVACARCGEPVMSTRTRKVGRTVLCIPCAESSTPRKRNRQRRK